MLLAFMAAFVGANLNAVPGGGTFITYPVLLLLGNNSLAANATSTVILWPGALTSLSGFKKEIKKNNKYIKLYFLPIIFGSIVGSAALINTPSSLFYFIAPVLIVIGSLMMQFRDGINKRFKNLKVSKENKLVISMIIIFVIASYGSYFGAGIGILLLAALSILGIKNIYENIAIKNVLAIITNFVALSIFVYSGLVSWHYVPVMILGSVLGGYSGSRLIRKVDQRIVKDTVIALGYTMAIFLVLFKFL